MKNLDLSLVTILILFLTQLTLGQSDTNCFLEDYYPKYIAAPKSELAQKPTESPTVFVTINSNDTLGEISNYMFGNAFPAWMGNVTGDQVLLNNLQILAPSFIRYPGGSWADIFFWNGMPTDVPDTIWDGSQNKWVAFYPQTGTGSWPTTVDNYYNMRDAIGCEGLITINYAYARYGTSDDPVAQAAHLAADWVRYDNGRTRFWEIGNENGGPWEAGWKIDTTINKDGQPEVISGELYGKQFNVFVDSMKAAAAEIEATIYIGGQVLHYDGTNSWNSVDKKWNEGFFKEAGNTPDFYLMHNYFGNQSNTLKGEIDNARTELLKNINFIRSDISAKNAFSRPVAITEWNCNGPDNVSTSVANGMQAVVLFSEMIKNNFGLSARWLIATGETGLLYAGSDSKIPAWNPRPAYFYIYYLENFTGDHSVNTTVSGSSDILAYATTFTSGHDAIIIVNKGNADQIIKITPFNSVGAKYYIYSLTGGDSNDFSQAVVVNDTIAGNEEWGPFSKLKSIPAKAYETGDIIKFKSPSKSVQYILTGPGSIVLAVNDKNKTNKIYDFSLSQNYPNPFNPTTKIKYTIPSKGISLMKLVQLKIFDILGREVAALVNKSQSAGDYEVLFNASNLNSGVYFYQLITDNQTITRKMMLIK